MPMTIDPHGIPVPDTTASVQPDIVLLPLLAFDAAGYRLGYGGGYFDRTLANAMPRPLAVGVGFDLNAVATTWPGQHDIPLDVVVTESGVHPRSPGDTP
jgi:5,10-methenyltetrahydrofolate synthetase